ncbi:class I SAM-dependent methyltransferase [Dendronalium sp. ChiSLP03b]|uniref:class I SAM-dependent methyltransferase n=1 Tax=Dendronalium sp. ChiSLP03b TaxID=3075381 RepID=UPI002AD423F6|nr:class I SAM-dependent methyltransferase [Dendronalium sp. ChiSLP03b]MDZ8206780.1 class I SAM-dependent methyltransferase [Dendronalium sp. ChiSLP03b]
MTFSQLNSFDKISPTALLMTYARQFSDTPYAAELAQIVDAQTVFDQYASDGFQKLLHLSPIVEARYKAVNHVLAKFESTQIMELASGLLPRGMVMSQDPKVTYVESDLPTMIDLKKQIVTQLIGERSNLHFEAIDATNLLNNLPLHTNYLRSSEKVIVLCEGLLQYLTFSEKEQVFTNVREMLQHYGGVWITTDIVTKERQLQMQGHDLAMQNFYQTIANTTGRSILNNTFNNMEHAKEFILKQGFCIEEYSTLEVIEELTSLQRLGVTPESIKPLLATMPVFVLTLNACT